MWAGIRLYGLWLRLLGYLMDRILRYWVCRGELFGLLRWKGVRLVGWLVFDEVGRDVPECDEREALEGGEEFHRRNVL